MAQASQPYDVKSGLPPGHMEQDPALWTDAVEKTVADVLQQLGARKAEVKGIGISGQQHGFVPLDKEKNVIRAAKLWCDTSTADECRVISEHFGGLKGLLELTGLDMLPGFTAPKIFWLKRHEPENFKKLAHILLPHDYLNFFLTGDLKMEYGDASGTALMNVRTRAWSKEVCDFIDPKVLEVLPKLGSSRPAWGPLQSQWSKKWGLSEGVLVSAGGGDNMMGAIGTGNVKAGRVTASLGTSGTIYAYAEKPVIDPDGEIAAFCDSTDAWLPLLCTMNVTVATEQVRHLFGWDHGQLEAAVRKTPAGANGILFLPYLQGERTPNLPGATGVLHGLTTANYTPENLARATMEGVTLGMAYGLEKLKHLDVTASEIRLIGGGSKSAIWRQLCADVFGCPVVTTASPEGAALGGAIQALAVVDTKKTVTEWSDTLVETKKDERAEPQKEVTGLYQELLKKQTALTRHLAAKQYL
jgi:xylulokinase